MNIHTYKTIDCKDNNTYTLFCQECFRQVVLTMEPYSKIVITEGNPSVQHSWGSGGLVVSNVEVQQKDYLEPFSNWVDNNL